MFSVVNVEDIIKPSKREKGKIKREKTKSEVEREKHLNNTNQVLEFSNATPIRKQVDGGYCCCYCPKKFPEPADLKRHTLNIHSDCDVSQASFMTKVSLNCYLVKLDITDLTCKLCGEDMATLELLMEHLKKNHGKKIHSGVKNRMIPFKFSNGNDLRCFVCSNVFHKLKSLTEHMNVHYRNFICEICDAGFVTNNMAAKHAKTHMTGSFKCDYCPKVFATVVKKKNHERSIHTHFGRQNKCSFCGETFKHYFQKAKHLTESHGVVGTVKCQSCELVLPSQNALRNHVRKTHLMERPHKCTSCDKAFFSKGELKEHLVKHTKEKPFQCETCLKSYGTRKSLVVHMRSHSADKQS